jgi:hypothetical protein
VGVALEDLWYNAAQTLQNVLSDCLTLWAEFDSTLNPYSIYQLELHAKNLVALIEDVSRLGIQSILGLDHHITYFQVARIETV